jgi:hypothetical protein
MFRYVLILFFCFQAHADFLGFKTSGEVKSKIPDLVEKLKNLKMDNGPLYEDGFNQIVKSIENAMEEEKLYCSGEAADSNGKFLMKDKELCFREIKTNYLEALDTIFNLKKKYLGFIHAKQISELTAVQKKLRNDIEKTF